MLDLEAPLTHTRLRARYERAREMSFERQVSDCVDYLQNPEILVCEFLDAFQAVEIACQSEGLSGIKETEEARGEELVLEYFPAGLEVAVLGADPYAFRCVASGLDPLPPSWAAEKGERQGLDYLAGIDAPRDGVALGVVRSESEPSSYVLFLRLLACLSELASASQLERLGRQIPEGQLDPEPTLDLHLVLWSTDEDDQQSRLTQFTHDLADIVKRELEQSWQFPRILRSIDCLRMDPDAFDGRLMLDWRV